jgi:glucose-1-phosphate adenylyltransferase
LHRGYWADVGTVRSYYDANIALTRSEPPFQFYDSRRPIYSHPRFLPGSRLEECTVREGLISDGCAIGRSTIEQSVVGVRSVIREGCTITRSLLLGADYYESEDMAPARGALPPVGIGRNAVLDRAIVDKNARVGDEVRLVNERGVQDADGEGYYIRDGIVIVPKEGVVPDGTVV